MPSDEDVIAVHEKGMMTMASEHDEKKPEDTIELSVDDLEEASGGYVLRQDKDYGSFPYVVIDDKTGKVGSFHNILGNAQADARRDGFSDEVISTGQFEQLFGRKWGERR